MTNSPDPDWDIEQYRHFWESNEHWAIRRDFMEEHKSRFPEDKLVCLAQVYANVELLGCRYPSEVMQQIAHLAKDLEKPKKRNSEVAFVKGSSNNSRDQTESSRDSAAGLTKRSRRMSSITETEPKRKPQSIDFSVITHDNQLSASGKNTAECFLIGQSYSQQLNNERTLNNNLSNQTASFYKAGGPSGCDLNSSKNADNSGTFNNAILRKLYGLQKKLQQCKGSLDNVVNQLEISASKSHLKCRWLCNNVPGRQSHNPLFECIVYIEEVRVGSDFGPNKKLARKNAYSAVLSNLGKKCLSIVMDDSKELRLISNGDATSSNQQLPVTENYNNATIRDFVIIESVEESNNPIGILYSSAGFSGARIQFQNDFKVATVIINGNVIASASAETQQQAKREAAEAALSILRKNHFTVKIKKKFVSDGDVARWNLPDNKKKEEAISDDNIGNKLLRLMGWTGGGLGKDGLGISEPIKASNVHGREGLGSSQGRGVTKQFKTHIDTLVRDYAMSNTYTDLTFSPDFSNEERKEIHQIANKYRLKSVSRGKGEERFLIISRKMNSRQLLQHLMEFGGSTDKYELHPPGDYSQH